MTRIRSPNYPALGLNDAVDRLKMIYKAEGKNAAPREALAKILGYGGLNGASATMLSALVKYGLLERAGEDGAKVSQLGLRIVYPNPDDEKDRRDALEKAALSPQIFNEIRAKWPETPPSDESLRYFLHTKGYTEQAVKQVVGFYREIIDIVGKQEAVQVAPGQATPEHTMNAQLPRPEISQTDASQPIANIFPSAPTAQSLGRPFIISFDGHTLTGTIALKSAAEVDRLIKTLQAQRPLIAEVQDEEDPNGG